MMVLCIEEYERQIALTDLYGKLAVAEHEEAMGDEGEDLDVVLAAFRARVHGTV